MKERAEDDNEKGHGVWTSGRNGCAKGAMPWSEDYPESHKRQLNAPRGAAEELEDLLDNIIDNRASLFVMVNPCSGL